MVDPLDIKKSYAAMSDAELLHFASNEGANLTPEAFQIMRSEFSARQMPADIIERIENGSHVEEMAIVKKMIKAVPEQSSTTALAMAINEKRDGESDEMIVYHLMEQGLEEEHARLIIAQLRPEADALLKKSNTTMLTSIFIVLAGLSLELITPEKSFITFLDIASTCTMIYGTLRFLKGYFDYNKYKTVVRMLKSDG